MAELTPFGQSLQAQGGAPALLRLQGYQPGTREYKRAYDVLYNLSTGRQKGTEKYENIRAGVEQRAERQRRPPAPTRGRPKKLIVAGEIRVSNDWEYRQVIRVDFPLNFDRDYLDTLDNDDARGYVHDQFTRQFAHETGIMPELDLEEWDFQ